MDTQNDLPQNGPVRVNLAVQVAGIAAQVTAAIRSGEVERRQEVEAKLSKAREQLQEGAVPPGLVPFIDVMCGLLRGSDMSVPAADLPRSYYAVYEQVLAETQQEDREDLLTLRQVLDEVVHHAILAIKGGTPDQCRMMANTLLRMQRESGKRPDLEALIDFLKAVRALLREEDPAPFVVRLQGPFLVKWQEIVDAIRE
jgi:hypothetical protein